MNWEWIRDKILPSLLVGAVIAFFGVFTTIKVMEYKVNSLEKELDKQYKTAQSIAIDLGSMKEETVKIRIDLAVVKDKVGIR